MLDALLDPTQSLFATSLRFEPTKYSEKKALSSLLQRLIGASLDAAAHTTLTRTALYVCSTSALIAYMLASRGRRLAHPAML